MSLSKLTQLYPHIKFQKQWDITTGISYLLGQCCSLVTAINNTPIMPSDYTRLMNVSLIKGVQATTAIEGNTLTEDEIIRVSNKESLPPSKEYQEIEVKNILDAFFELFSEEIEGAGSRIITPELLLRFHELIGKGLGVHFEAIPGKMRERNVTVGKYRAPDSTNVREMIELMCSWLRDEFGYGVKKQHFKDVIIQAIVSHIYIEWIHPFGDGNGRSGRLLEFYILMRGGSPNIASHILSNHYNLTRNEYYRQIENATQKRDLTEFINYALVGFRDGLENTLETIQSSQLMISWQRLVYDKFDSVSIGNKVVFKRRRNLGLNFPLDKALLISEISDYSIPLAKSYSGFHERTLRRDVEELIRLDILIRESDKVWPNIESIKQMMAIRKKC